MLHHPASSTPSAWHKRLIDAGAFRAVVAQRGAELVIHGHEHETLLEYIEGPHRPVPMVGVPSASADPARRDEPAGYNLYRIASDGNGWRCEIVSRGLRPDGTDVIELRRTTFA
jgi:3',5'-cyclic AMP phosphodiesterase CpdA